MKWLKRIVVLVLLLLIVGGVVTYLYLDRVIKTQVETQTTKQLALKTELGSAGVSLFGGKLNLSELRIASPTGFNAPHMLQLGKADVQVSYKQLGNDPVRIGRIALDKPKLVIERVGGTINFKKAADLMPQRPPAKAADPNAEPLKLIIDELNITNAEVVMRAGIPGLPEEIKIPVPSVLMKNIGTGPGSENGAAVKDVVMQVITALAGAAGNSSLLPAEFKEFQAILNGDLSAVVGQLGAEAQKQVLAAVPGEAGKLLSSLVADPASLTKDPGKAIGGLLNQATGGTTLPSNPADLVKDPGKAAGALQGLLGKDKDKRKK